MFALTDIAAQVFFGLSKAAILFLIACGLSIIFGMLNVINFAHGSLFMMGGFFAISLLYLLGQSEVSLWLILLVLAPFLVALLGIVFKFGIDAISRGPPETVAINSLIFTVGLAMVFSDLARTIWGGEVYSYPKPSLISGSIPALGRMFPLYDAFNIILILALGFLLTYLFFKTKIGTIVRAIAFDAKTASAMGVDVRKVSLAMFMFGSFMAGLGGSIQAMVVNVSFHTWEKVIIEAFVVAVVGGLGSFRGTLLAAIIIGLAESFAIFFFAWVGPWIGQIIMFIVLAVVLLIKPRGIFGGRF